MSICESIDLRVKLCIWILEVIKERAPYERRKFLNNCIKRKEFINHVSNRTNCTPGIPSISSGDIELTGDAEKGEAFSQYYSSVYTRDNNLMSF